MPPFLDRGKEANILIDHDFIEKNMPKKHLHYNPSNLTTEGMKFHNHLKNKGLSGILKKIEIENHESFLKSFSKLVKSLLEPKWFTNYNNHDELIDLALPSIGKICVQRKVKLKVLRYRNLNEDLQFEFEFSFSCDQCKHENVAKIVILFDEFHYKPQNFQKQCSNCLKFFHCDAQFSRFSMDRQNMEDIPE